MERDTNDRKLQLQGQNTVSTVVARTEGSEDVPKEPGDPSKKLASGWRAKLQRA